MSLLLDDAHLLDDADDVGAAHRLSTIVVAEDFSVQIVLAGESGLAVKFWREAWRALDSRVVLRISIMSEEVKAA